MKLDRLAELARGDAPEWTEERARRILAATRVRGELRGARTRLARRSLGISGIAAAMVVMLLRGASAPAEASTTDGMDPSPSPLMASHDHAMGDGDGGYDRD